MSGKIPRLSLGEMPPALASALAPRVQRLGYLGEFFQCTAHQPAALLSFIEFTENLKHALPDNLTEVIALSVAVLMQNDYERVQHERLAIKLGFSGEWLQETLSLGADGHHHLSDVERLVQHLAVCVVRRGGRDTTAELEAVVQAAGPDQAIAALMLIGRYMSHAVMVNSLNLAPPALAVARGGAL